MSRTLSNQEVTEFEDMVKHEYQSYGDGVAMAVRTKRITNARDANFPRYGQAQAHTRTGPSEDVIPLNVDSDRIKITLNDYEAPEYTDIFQQEVTNVDDRAELVKVIMGAMKRREEQDIFDGLVDLDATAVTSKDDIDPDDAGQRDKAFKIAHGGTGMTTGKIARTKAIMKIRNVVGMLHAVVHADALEQMLDNDKIGDRDTDRINSLVDGEITRWQGFQWHFIGRRLEGGLPTTGTGSTRTYTNYFWDSMSIGLIKSMLDRTDIDWVAQKSSWLVNAMFQCGSEAIDPQGITIVEHRDA